MRHSPSVAFIAACALTLSAAPALGAEPLTLTTVNDPPVAPHALTAFPARDFLSADGLTPGDTVVFEVTHSAARGGGTVASKPFLVGDDGLAEVNHPGGTCWDVVTPNIVAGDTVRVVVTSSPDGPDADDVGDRNGHADVTHVADVTAARPVNTAPGTITVRGTAATPEGSQFTDLTAIAARLVAAGDLFDKSGKRDLRAGTGELGTLAYDEPGSTTDVGWTATWTGLTDADVERALGAEARGMWLGRDVAAGTEVTIYESGAGVAGGPQSPCTAPKERLAPLPGEDAVAPDVPTGLTAVTSDLNTVTLDWADALDNTGVTNYGVYRDGVPVFTVQNATASAPAPSSFVDRNVPAGSHTYTVDAADAMDNRSAASDGATAVTEARPATPATPVSNPPTHPFTVFPSRDMVNVEGLTTGQTADVEVIRNGQVVSDSPGLVPDTTGMVEINHAGSYCWTGTTPDIRANDQVRATARNADGSVAWVDEATVANVTAGRAALENGVITIHGTAIGHDGKPLPVGQLEQRLVSSSAEPFGNGRRTLRADAGGAGDGTLSYDPVSADNPVGTRWTATYPGLDATDQARAQQVESRIMWLGREALAGLELTIFEVGGADSPGPATPDCVAPFETVDTAPPTAPSVSAAPVDGTRDVALSWTGSSDDVYVYGYRVFADGKQVAQVGGTTTTFTVEGVAPGTHTYVVEAYDSASPTGTGATGVEKVQAGLGKPYGNTSPRSDAVSVTVRDIQAPSVPANLQVTNPTIVDPTTGAVTGTRNARVVFDPSTDDSGTDPTYEVYRDGVLLPAAVPTRNTAGKMVFTDTRLTNGQTYRYAVLAKDTAGNRSAKSAEVAVTIAADAEPPTFTGTPTATVPDIHGREVVLTWAAGEDTIGVTAYGIYRDGTRIATVGGTTLTYTDSGLAAGTYRYKVDAVDSAGNRSDRATQPAQLAAIANDPPSAGHSVTLYPARDFVEGSGYLTTDPATGAKVGATVVVEVFRNGKIVGQARTRADSTGLVEVNHAGPGCWGTAAYANTPDIRPGDVARITPLDTDVPDQATAANVYVGRPIQTAADTVVLKGTAADAAGKPLPLDQLEARIISDGAEFRLNARKMLLAPGDATLTYDAPGSTAWTATYKGLVAADVTRALAGETVVNWLGRSPLIGSELTIFENGPGTDGGPATGVCTAPLDPSAPLVSLNPRTQLGFGNQSALPATTSAAKPVVLTNAGSSTVTLRNVYLGGAHPGDFAITPATLPATLAPGASVTVNVTFSPKAIGARSATVSFTDDAANTTYQTVALSGTGVDAAAPSAPTGFARSLAAGTVTTTVPVTLRWNASATGTVTRYQLQKSVAGGAFADVPAAEQPAATVFDPATGAVTTPAATTVTVQVATGSATRYQVRACNGANCSTWATLAAFTLAPFQENNAAVTPRGTWTRSALTGAFGGSVSSSSAAGSGVTLKTNGTGFAVISTKGPDRGNAEVWLNGTRVATVNLYAPSVQPAQVVFTREGLANTTHQVELRAQGTRTAPSTGNRVDIDGFIALR